MRIVQVFIAIVCLLGVATAEPLTLNQITEGVCRVTAENTKNGSFGSTQNKTSMGSGTVVGESSTSYYVLTNAHVVGNAQNVKLEFFKSGLKTTNLPANVIWKHKVDGSDIDFAVCEISKSYFGSYPPRIIPLAPPNYILRAGYYISCVGCDDGRWARGWEGSLRQDQQTRVIFTPAPVGGQSGSGIMVLIPDSTGALHTRVGAILTWRIGHATDDEQATGGAIPISRLYQSMRGSTSHNTIPANYSEVGQTIHAGTKALGSDGKVYVTRRLSTGGFECAIDPGVWIVDWNYSKDCACPRCGGNHYPYNTDRWSPFKQPAPQPKPQPNPQPTPSNPYGSVPPNIGAPWPQPPTVDPVGPIKPIVPIKPDVVIDDKVIGIAADYEKLLVEKKRLEDELLAAEGAARTERDRKVAEEKEEKEKKEKKENGEATEVTFFGNISSLFGMARGKLSGFGGGTLFMLGVWLLRVLWVKKIRPNVIIKVNSLQDYIQQQVEERLGKDAGEQAREMMEGVEDELLAVIDNVVQGNKQKAKTEVSKIKLTDRITNGEGAMLGASKAEMLEAIRVASAEIDDKDSPTTAKDVPERVKQILKAAKK